MNYAQRAHVLRIARGLCIREAAKIGGLSVRSIIRLEAGQAVPKWTAEYLDRLFAAPPAPARPTRKQPKMKATQTPADPTC